MRGILYAVILTSLLYVPLKRVNVADLLPVEAVAVYREDGKVVLETDTGDRGRGNTVPEAIRDLEKESASVVYMDTARYLILSPNAEEYTQQLRSVLRGSVRVCLGDAKGNVREVSDYLSAHEKLPKLRNWKP